MIKFFRRIRQRLLSENKFSRYLLYAIGEIILVVIGILIALQINNWNENRKERLHEKEALGKFLQDLESDSNFYQTNLRRTVSINNLHRELYLIGSNQKVDLTHEKPNYIRRGLVFHPVAKENNPKIVDKLTDTEIREAIQSYFRLMSEVQEAVNEYDTAVLEIRAFLRKHHIHQIKPWFEGEMFDRNMGEKDVVDIIQKEDLAYLAKDQDFNQLLFESSLKINETKEALGRLIDHNAKLMNHIKEFLGKI